MSVQYRDGSFGEIKPFPESMEEFMHAVESNTAKALHVGTREELIDVQDEQSNSDKIEALRTQVSDLSARVNENRIIAIPTYNEIKEITGE